MMCGEQTTVRGITSQRCCVRNNSPQDRGEHIEVVCHVERMDDGILVKTVLENILGVGEKEDQEVG